MKIKFYAGLFATLLIVAGMYFLSASPAHADNVLRRYDNGTSNVGSAGGFNTVPEGSALTAIGYGSDDHQCWVYIKTAPVNPDGTVNFSQVDTIWRGDPNNGLGDGKCASGGGADDPSRLIDYQNDQHVAVGWSWGASTSGGKPGDDSSPPDECFYQEYAPLTAIGANSGSYQGSGWGAQYDGSCNERGYQSTWLKKIHRAPAGRVIVGVGLVLDDDGSVSWLGMQTRHATLPSGNINASPNPCTIVSGSMCNSDITWTTQGVAEAQVWLVVDGNTGGETLFGNSPSGTGPAPWIQANHVYTFNLYNYTSGSRGNLLDSVDVTAVTAAAPAIQTSINDISLSYGGPTNQNFAFSYQICNVGGASTPNCGQGNNGTLMDWDVSFDTDNSRGWLAGGTNTTGSSLASGSSVTATVNIVPGSQPNPNISFGSNTGTIVHTCSNHDQSGPVCTTTSANVAVTYDIDLNVDLQGQIVQ